jgi:hypothetical protein
MTTKFETYNYFDASGTEVVALEILEDKFKGSIFSFGKVEFPDPNEPILNFEYTLHQGYISDDNKEDFKNCLGDILVQILEESLKDKTTVFKGGIDE